MFKAMRKWVKRRARKSDNMSKVTAKEMTDFFLDNFPGDRGELPQFIHVEDGKLTLAIKTGAATMRPGGFVSGPTQMALADHAAYAVIFTRIGITPMAMTTHLNIDFLRPCIGRTIIAEADIIHVGRSRVIISVSIRGEESEKIASRSTVTYALPTQNQDQ